MRNAQCIMRNFFLQNKFRKVIYNIFIRIWLLVQNKSLGINDLQNHYIKCLQ